MNFVISYQDGKIVIDNTGEDDFSLILTKIEFLKYLACMETFYKQNKQKLWKEAADEQKRKCN